MLGTQDRAPALSGPGLAASTARGGWGIGVGRPRERIYNVGNRTRYPRSCTTSRPRWPTQTLSPRFSSLGIISPNWPKPVDRQVCIVRDGIVRTFTLLPYFTQTHFREHKNKQAHYCRRDCEGYGS